jgi:CubicO group peptidase (beta-lactamase class C family)
VEERAGEPADSFLMRELLLPMRVQEAAFSRCPKNHPIGATGLYIRAKDMVKLGWLYINGGMYEGKKLISERWISEEERDELAFRSCGAGDLRGKGGMYGQMLMFSREKGFAAAWHSFTPDHRAEGLPRFIGGVF